jgi:hypothetical protein
MYAHTCMHVIMHACELVSMYVLACMYVVCSHAPEEVNVEQRKVEKEYPRKEPYGGSCAHTYDAVHFTHPH